MEDGTTLMAPPQTPGLVALLVVDRPADLETSREHQQVVDGPADPETLREHQQQRQPRQPQVGLGDAGASSSSASSTGSSRRSSRSSAGAREAPAAASELDARGGSDEPPQDGATPQLGSAAEPSRGWPWYDWLGTPAGILAVVKAHIILDLLPGFLSTLLSVNCYEWANADDSILFDSTLTQYLRWVIFLRVPVLAVIMTACDDLVRTPNWKAADHRTFHVCRHRLLLIAALSAPISFKTLASPLVGGGCRVDETAYVACMLVAPIYNLVLGVVVIMATLSSMRRVLPINATCKLQDLPGVNAEDVEGGELCCVICLDKLEAEHEVTQLTCHHIFHRGCIDPWLDRHYGCPLRCQADQQDTYISSS